MSNDDRLTRFGQPQRFALSQVQGDEMRLAMTHKKCAFTLAEVLITLGIIGVVAALTIPTLMQNIGDKRTISQVKKEYSVLSRAWNMMQLEYGSIDKWGITNDAASRDLIAKRLKEYLNVSKECPSGEQCYDKTVWNLAETNSGTTGNATDDNQFYLNDGSFVYFGWYDTGTGFAEFNVILPNTKKPVYGKSIFVFMGGPNGMIPEGALSYADKQDYWNVHCKKTSNEKIGGRGCTAWVIYNENLDYLYCRDELSWNGKRSCNE